MTCLNFGYCYCYRSSVGLTSTTKLDAVSNSLNCFLHDATERKNRWTCPSVIHLFIINFINRIWQFIIASKLLFWSLFLIIV